MGLDLAGVSGFRFQAFQNPRRLFIDTCKNWKSYTKKPDRWNLEPVIHRLERLNNGHEQSKRTARGRVADAARRWREGRWKEKTPARSGWSA
jgi:hypothetical protein